MNARDLSSRGFENNSAGSALSITRPAPINVTPGAQPEGNRPTRPVHGTI
jgi:hypothetical protein